MRITHRDVLIVKDVALSRILSRDDLIHLRYFNSIPRANARLLTLVKAGMLRRLATPFFHQSLYIATKRASEVVGERIAPLVESRSSSPRFVQHSLQTTALRIALTRKMSAGWRFEQQLWRRLEGGYSHQLRPDGCLLADVPVFLETDMGHCSLPRFREKVLGYHYLATSGQCANLYGFSDFRLLIATTGSLRARHLRRAVPPEAGFEVLVQTFESLDVPHIQPWS